MEIWKAFFDGIISLCSTNPTLVIAVIAFALLALLSDLYYPKFRGFMGEFWVKLELRKLPKDKYIIIQNNI